MLIHLGLYAPAPESGKSTVAEYLHQKSDYTRLSFAEPLKRMIAVLLNAYGIVEERIVYYLYDSKGKSEVIPEIGKTSRYLFQTLGTEWGRNLVNRDLWVNAVKTRIEQASTSTVTDDVRFETELVLYAQPNRYLVKIVRPDAPTPENAAHESNRVFPDHMFDYVVINDGTLDDLYKSVTEVIVDIENNGVEERVCKTRFVKPAWTVVL